MRFLIFIFVMLVIVAAEAATSTSPTGISEINLNTVVQKPDDVKGWGPVRWGMGAEEIRKEFGNRFVKTSPDSLFSPPIYEHTIRDVSIGPLNVDLSIGDTGKGVSQLASHYESIMSFQQAEKLYADLEIEFSKQYGKAEILMNALSQTQTTYTKRMRWKFPTTTVVLMFIYRFDLQKSTITIQFSEALSKKHSVVFSREGLDDLEDNHSLVVVAWNLKPIFIFNRDKEDITHIRNINVDELADPTSTGVPSLLQSWMQEKYPVEEAGNLEFPQLRSRIEKFGVFSASSPISGCILLYFTAEIRGGKRFSKAKTHAMEQWGDDWRGFYDPCANEYFDMAGRAYKDDDFSSNLSIPKHRYDNEGNLIIGY